MREQAGITLHKTLHGVDAPWHVMRFGADEASEYMKKSTHVRADQGQSLDWPRIHRLVDEHTRRILNKAVSLQIPCSSTGTQDGKTENVGKVGT